ncbi:hypothetical protein O181_038566 [Austropuccinia psidii MF-1]|uniref:Uncharacterized protein n=1 Tax=Austropuccinia psidii MF-1 TaxID=1389203 RepID=A0A9Q3HBR7_9BASI|nr:hypothetical protein [Austropuccinia psidii MF-1]
MKILTDKAQAMWSGKNIKKASDHIMGQHFGVQFDAKALIQMINSPCLPNSPIKRWVAFIKLFSFELVRKPGKTFTIPDVLSRRPQVEDDEQKEASEFDEEEDWIKPHPGLVVKDINMIRFSGVKSPESQEGFLKGMEEYIRTLERPVGSKDEDSRKIKIKSPNFFLEDGQLKKRNKQNTQVVVSSQKTQNKILEELNEKMGHRGENET